MAEKKVHKKEVAVKAEPTPQVKKIKDLRSTGISLREIAERLNISRSEVEKVLSVKPKVEEAKAKKSFFKKGK